MASVSKWVRIGRIVSSSALLELGANCAIGSWEDVADLDRLCDEVGLDTIETGAAIAIYMDAGKMEADSKFKRPLGVR